MIVNNSLFPANFNYRAISDMRSELSKLQLQLATGNKAQTLSELGGDRVTDITLRARINSIGSYNKNIDMVDIRVNMMSTLMTRVDKIESEARSSAQKGTYKISGVNMTAAQHLAQTRMTELIDIMNSHLNGRHLFGGNDIDEKPVANFDAIMNGKDGADGFRKVLNERKLADLGTGNMGRLTSGIAGTTITLAEDGTHPFGFKLDTLTSDGTNVTLTGPTGTPKTSSVAFTGQPADQQRIIFALKMPDGRSINMEMKAVAGAPSKTGEFSIGANPAATAANFKTAMDAKIQELSQTELVAGSAFAASKNFFAANGETVQRVSGPPFETATTLVAATPANTVMWYTGQSATDPRRSVEGRVDDSTRVSYGVQANESGITRLMRSVAVFAAEGFTASDPHAKLKYQSLSKAVTENLAESHNSEKGSIEVIQMELGLAKTTNGRVKERHTQQNAMLNNMLTKIEAAPKEEVAMKILALQTRLQASYQTTATVSRLTLVNYVK